ncbi:mRNA-binding ribosome synthesis protein nop7 [Dimargaris xerosporica]|nr:mRNA-binding ribosome synthesis protein nop7 [Dimargaris xerosporica]
MGVMRKKGSTGTATRYLSRGQVLKRLQLSLADFRRLCILKGVYPREPPKRNKLRGNHKTTYYYTKDIRFLMHEPLIAKFREHKIFLRRLSRVIARNEKSEIRHMRESRPVLNLNHLIRERYPSFADALRDLDDALCLLFLFATMPAHQSVDAARVTACRLLCAQFQHYVIQTRALRRTFLSIKGIYYQAEIKGQNVTWLVPFQFSQEVPKDVDFRIMATFLQFYETLMGFVNFRLFQDLNLVYPPQLNLKKWCEGEDLDAFELRPSNHINGLPSASDSAANQRRAARKLKETANRMKSVSQKISELEQLEPQDANNVTDPLASAMQNDEPGADEPMADSGNDIAEFVEAAKRQREQEQKAKSPQDAAGSHEGQSEDTGFVDTSLLELSSLEGMASTLSEFQNLFKGKVVYLSREVPRSSLVFVIRAFGGEVAWDSTVVGGSPYTETDTRITHQICDRPSLQHTVLGRAYVQPQWAYDSANFQRLMPVEAYAPGKVLPPHLSPFVEYKEGDYVPDEAKTLPLGITDGVAAYAGDFGQDDDEDEAANAKDEFDDEYDGPTIEDELEAEAAGMSFEEYAAQKTAASGKLTTENPKAAAARKALKRRAAVDQEETERQTMLKSVMSKRQRKQYASARRDTVGREKEARKLRDRKAQLAINGQE